MSRFIIGYRPIPDVARAEIRFTRQVAPFLKDDLDDAWGRDDALTLCWHWTGSYRQGGLPYFTFAGRAWPVHRFAYTLWVDSLEPLTVNGTRLVVRPLLCPRVVEHQPLCVNPYHLMPVPANYRPSAGDAPDELFAAYAAILDLEEGDNRDDVAARHGVVAEHMRGWIVQYRAQHESRRRFYNFVLKRLRDNLERKIRWVREIHELAAQDA